MGRRNLGESDFWCGFRVSGLVVIMCCIFNKTTTKLRETPFSGVSGTHSMRKIFCGVLQSWRFFIVIFSNCIRNKNYNGKTPTFKKMQIGPRKYFLWYWDNSQSLKINIGPIFEVNQKIQLPPWGGWVARKPLKTVFKWIMIRFYSKMDHSITFQPRNSESKWKS